MYKYIQLNKIKVINLLVLKNGDIANKITNTQPVPGSF